MDELELARLVGRLLELGDLAILAFDLVVVVSDCVYVVGFGALAVWTFGIDGVASLDGALCP